MRTADRKSDRKTDRNSVFSTNHRSQFQREAPFRDTLDPTAKHSNAWATDVYMEIYQQSIITCGVMNMTLPEIALMLLIFDIQVGSKCVPSFFNADIVSVRDALDIQIIAEIVSLQFFRYENKLGIEKAC